MRGRRYRRCRWLCEGRSLLVGPVRLVLAAKLCQRDSQRTMDIFGRAPDGFRVRFPTQQPFRLS